PIERDTSSDALRPRSALIGLINSSRDRPAASVASVTGEGAKKPLPNETRVDHAPVRISAETRGLTCVPSLLCASTRPLADTLNQRASSASSWMNAPGTLYAKPN